MVQKANRTQGIGQTQIIQSLESIYISPLESCNLACKYCYTHKTSDVLSNQQILEFIEKYNSYLKSLSKKTNIYHLKSIILCGGEVFLLPNFPHLVNTLIDKNIFVTIITNGTIDRLQEIKNPNSCQILVSLDGPKDIHDQNRGSGNFDKSIKYIKHAQKLGFPVGIMFLVTKDSYPYKDTFDIFGLPKTYLTDRKMSLTNDQCLDIKLHYPTFPNKNFGCYQLSLQSNGNITGCCESSISLGKITDNPQIYISKFIKDISPCFTCGLCQGCCDQSYLCGYPQEFHQNSCQGIIKLINK
ncbi:MAG: radical SAM protein [Candidatus Shapirobacteria bacterium]|nr:radical SAM protein [Candidatus Shapirobacteria bacterium]